MFMHPEDFLSMEKMRHAELIKQREFESRMRAAHPRKTRYRGVAGHSGAKAMARRVWRAVISLFTDSQQASATTPVRDAGPVATPDSTTPVGPQLTGSSPAR
jgi:hypothetical protein